MNFLIIHGNYPAQFRYIAPLLGQSTDHNVVFLTAREDAEKEIIKGVKIRNYKKHREGNTETHHYLASIESAVLEGQAVLREVIKLSEEGFVPDIVITHGGMGIGLFIKDILPKCLHIGYFEWYFRPYTTQHLVQEFNFDTQLTTGFRNLPILQELECCDVGVVPTKWQKKQFPTAYQSKLKVIFDGIDQQYFHPQAEDSDLASKDILIRNRENGDKYKIAAGSLVISYATRGMEPLRGFPEFMRSLPTLLSENQNLQVIIAGADRRAYSYDAPGKNGSWREYMMEEIGDIPNKDRIVFTGLLNYHDYRLLLWRTNLHCYFTREYVTSWSLFEAAACGARLAVNRSPATEGIAVQDTVTWVELDDQTKLIRTINDALKNDKNKRSKLREGYELSKCLHDWEILLNSELLLRK